MTLRILIADDVADSANALEALLRMEGHEVYTSYDGAEALAIALDLRPEVVLLDLQMPGLSGFDVCRAIRRQDWGQQILIVAHTGWVRDEDIRGALNAGFDLHMSKPMDIQTLLAALQQHT